MAFNLDLSDEIQLNYHLLKENKIFGDYPSFGLKSLNGDIYENDFVRLTPKIPTIELEIKSIDIFKEYMEEKFIENDSKFHSNIMDCLDKINFSCSFDQCHICSARLDFSFKFVNPIGTPMTIEILDDICCFIDKNLFPEYLKIKIEGILGISNHETELLQEHMTYPIVCSTQIDSDYIDHDRYDLFGISWIERSYNTFKDRTVNNVINNEIAPRKGDIIIIATPPSLMLFKNTDIYGKYVNERINAIEIFCRQQHLLKKLDLKLDHLIRKYNIETKNLKSVIKEIRHTQTDIQSSLEFYRNTKISSTNTFKTLFDTLNKVFELDKYYKTVNEKLNVCDNLFRSLHEERRNELTENIQWIVVLLGVSSLLVAIFTLIKDSNLAIIILVLIIVILLIIQTNEPGRIKDTILKFIDFINR